jgi:hypothetical protein
MKIQCGGETARRGGDEHEDGDGEGFEVSWALEVLMVLSISCSVLFLNGFEKFLRCSVFDWF